jgi:hypothetical protein
LMQRKVEANGIIAENPRFNERLKKIYDADPSRCKKLQELLHKNDVDGIGLAQWEAETIDPDQFPFNILVQQIGPLRKWYNHQIAMEYQNMKGASAISLHLPKMSAIFQANEHLAHVIQTAMFQENTNGKILEEEDYWDTLSYLVPPQIQEKEQLAALIETNQFLQRDIRNNTRYLLSPRGDLIEITDNILKSLGFQSILYEMDNRNRRDTIVTVKVGNFEYRILLDEYLSLRETKSRKTLHLPLSAHFVTNIILSHLREIRCSEKVNDINGGTNGGEGARRAFTARRPHLRHLPTGQKPTTEQIQRALTTYDIDIIRINREAETRGENRKITFVFEAQNIVIVGQGPVHSRAPEATKKLQEILNR